MHTYGEIVSHIHLLDMTRLATSDRPQAGIEYCMQVRKTGLTGNEMNNSALVKRRITKCNVGILADLIHSLTGYDVINYFWSAFLEVRTSGRKCRLRRLLVEF